MNALKVAVFLLGALLAFAICGCASLSVDESASGGGRWAFETYHPCARPAPCPVGGNTGEVQNDTTRGGNVGTEHP